MQPQWSHRRPPQPRYLQQHQTHRPQNPRQQHRRQFQQLLQQQQLQQDQQQRFKRHPQPRLQRQLYPKVRNFVLQVKIDNRLLLVMYFISVIWKKKLVQTLLFYVCYRLLRDERRIYLFSQQQRFLRAHRPPQPKQTCPSQVSRILSRIFIECKI